MIRVALPGCLALLAILPQPATRDQRLAASFVGSKVCAGCHATQAEIQSQSQMARTLWRADQHPLVEQFRTQAARAAGLAYWLDRTPSGLTGHVTAAGEKIELPLQWAFGSGTHGVTFVSERGRGRHLEFRVSYYAKSSILDFTPGRAEFKFMSAYAAAGHVNDPAESLRCFSCHTTGTRREAGASSFRRGELGVQCEACHGPGSAHVQAASDGQADAGRHIKNPARLDAAGVLLLCGSCHRPPPTDPSSIAWSDPGVTRFQPIGLSQSRCYQPSRKALSCISCHDAHTNARRNDPNHYAKVCRGCHADAHKITGQGARVTDHADCVSCHMPKVQAFKHMSFSNHWIGIYKGEDRLVPH